MFNTICSQCAAFYLQVFSSAFGCGPHTWTLSSSALTGKEYPGNRWAQDRTQVGTGKDDGSIGAGEVKPGQGTGEMTPQQVRWSHDKERWAQDRWRDRWWRRVRIGQDSQRHNRWGEAKIWDRQGGKGRAQMRPNQVFPGQETGEARTALGTGEVKHQRQQDSRTTSPTPLSVDCPVTQ